MKNHMQKIRSNLFLALLRAKLISIKEVLIEKIINIYIWAGCTIVVMGYLMQPFGLIKNFGPFQLAGILAVAGLLEVYSHTASLLADLKGDCSLVYYLTLPTSIHSVLLSHICYYVIISMSECLALIILGKLMLWNQFNLASVSWASMLFFMLLINFVWATLVFVFTAHISSVDKMGLVWSRILYPLWFLGGFQFSWIAMQNEFPALAYLTLLNPVIYATEGIRAAMLGQADYLPLSLCGIALTAICLTSYILAFKGIKKRLDLV